MLKYEIKKFRVEVIMNEMLRSSCYWWTFTTPDSCDYIEVSRRWRKVRHWLAEKFPDFKYVQNFELHPKGHGWHIHFVCNAYISLHDLRIRKRLTSFGFSRVSVEKCYSNGLKEYLTKHCMKCYKMIPERKNKRFRLVNVSRSLSCPLSRFQSVFGLSDRWKDVNFGSFSERSIMVPFDFRDCPDNSDWPDNSDNPDNFLV